MERFQVQSLGQTVLPPLSLCLNSSSAAFHNIQMLISTKPQSLCVHCRCTRWGRTISTPRHASLHAWTARWRGTRMGRRSATQCCCPPRRSSSPAKWSGPSGSVCFAHLLLTTCLICQPSWLAILHFVIRMTSRPSTSFYTPCSKIGDVLASLYPCGHLCPCVQALSGRCFQNHSTLCDQTCFLTLQQQWLTER